MNVTPYLILKASAHQLPLPDNFVSLVIGTPPDFGVRCRPRSDFCTGDPQEYDLMIREFVREAMRIVRPRGHILVTESRPQIIGSKGARSIMFRVVQKQVAHGNWTDQRIGSETFFTHFVEVKGFPWWALSIQLYRNLIRRYSRRGEVVVHIFSGSGNGAIAALELARRPILIDLHYHRQLGRRLRKRLPLIRPLIVSPHILLDGTEVVSYTER